MLRSGTPYVSMKCSLLIMAVSPARKALQLIDGFWSVFVERAYPCPSHCSFNSESTVPCLYQPPLHPVPWTAMSTRFQPLGGWNGLGSGSEVGSCSVAL